MKDKDGKYEAVPPKTMTMLYDYLPSIPADAGAPKKRIPTRVTIRELAVNGLKEQGHACGVYSLLRKEEGGKPIWKHASADLVLAPAKLGSEDGWVVARFTTYGVRKEWCMRVVTNGAMPFGKQAAWQEWTGRDWLAANVACRPSYHGWGVEKLDRRGLNFSPSSPEGAWGTSDRRPFTIAGLPGH